MTANYGYFNLLAGKLKLATIVLAGLILTLSYVSYFLSDYTHNRQQHRHKFTGNELRSLWRELYLMGAVTIFFFCSIINLWLHCRSLEFYWKPNTAIYDFAYHCIAAILLSTSGLLFIVSAIKIYEFNCTNDNGCQLFILKLGTGFLSMLSSVIFGVTGTVVMTNRKDVERESLMFADAKSPSD